VGDVCGEASEGAKVLNLTCGSGAAFTGVAFASFGTPTGTCAGGFAQGACHAPSSLAVLQAACLGQNACTVVADASVFGGDPCYGVQKRLDARVTCSGGGGGGSVVVFANGSYVPGVAGVTGAWVNESAGTLSVAVGSGTYSLELSW
jgi:hypothetical protein